MTKLWLAGIALTALVAGPAMAADLPVRGPVYSPPPAVALYNWSGCYIGANVGGGWTSNSNTFGDPLPDPVTSGFAPINIGTNGSGVVAGGQAGCNLQVASNFVVGIEGDFSWSGVKGEGTVGPIESIPVPGAFPGSFATSTHEVAWVGSVRGRAGVAFDRLLVYVTAGVAFANLKTTADEVFLTGVSNPGSLDANRIGWVGGVGLEYAVTYNWIVRGEYLYHQFASDTFVGNRVPVLPTFGVEYSTGRTNLSVARLALSYKFGDPPPVINYSK
jgi:outer membrane immunogenic protein